MLIDTSTLLRSIQPRHPHFGAAIRAMEILPARGKLLHIVTQNLIELWVVATRPVEQNGLGMSASAAMARLEQFKTVFLLLPETPAIYPVWENVVTIHRVIGKPAHDVRLVAAMKVHGLSEILTFDRTGFPRFPGIRPVHPEELI